MGAGVVINGAGGRLVAIRGRLTDQQWAAAGFWAEGEKPSQACRMAGYAHPDTEAQRLKRNRDFMAAVRRLQTAGGVGLIGCGVSVLRAVAEDKGHAAADRVRAADRLVEIGFRLRDEAAAAEAAEEGFPDGVPGVPDGRGSLDLGDILTALVAETETAKVQPTDTQG